MTAPEFSDAEMIAEMIARSESSESLARAAGIMGEGNGWPATKAHAERLVLLYRAIAARLSATSRDWQPPPEAERPYGFRCQGWVPGWCDENDSGAYVWKDTPFWCGVTWSDDPDLDSPPAWVSDFGDVVEPTAFAPPPPPPTHEAPK